MKRPACAGAAAGPGSARHRAARCLVWSALIAAAVGVRLWNALAGPRMWGYDAWGHVAYVFFLDVYRGLPWADQGWSYFHPPLYYALGWLLAQRGDAETLMRGLALLGSAASLGTAWLAARVVCRAAPGRSGLAWVAFGAVAFLPVHLFVSPMPGNAMTCALLSTACLAACIANETRAVPTARGDLATGALAGLALLTRFDGAIALVAVCAAPLARALLGARRGAGLRRAAPRVALVAGAALLLAMPYYQRNLRAFGTPFPFSRAHALVAQVEREQAPGVRSWRDYIGFSPALFRDPDPRAPHMLHAVWSVAYAGMWADLLRESDVERELQLQRWSARMAWLGLLPSGLALVGLGAAVADLRRGRRRGLHPVLLLQLLGTLVAFAIFSWRVPIWSALKSSYLLGLSLPWAVFLARGVEALDARAARGGRVLLALVSSGVAALCVLVNLSGVGSPRRADAPATGAVYFQLGELERARSIYGRLIAGSRTPIPWLDNLAAVELAQGDAASARRLYARALELERGLGRDDAYRRGQLAVATALTGDLHAASVLLDAALDAAELPELRANRGAIRAARGDAVGARRDLRAALALEPGLLPAWWNLAALEERAGRAAEAHGAHAEALRAACTSPRRYPHGVGTGEVLEWGVGRRWLLLAPADAALLPALPSFYRDACRLLSGGR
ncbi:MAG: hypothetical protein OEM49_11205 [Myxococcales bacterium]|nr:hypothetical protein [Myxococcales bacterium]MDH5307984.1 hypothetical protein [Myxococcales bacterium]MDH5566086.1 hypothetical protein [Myxococcales bacterium]